MDLPSWFEVIIRSATLVIVLFLLMKWLGKKQLSHLSFFEYVAGITIGSIAAEMSTGIESNFAHGLYSLVVWTAIPFFAGVIGLKSKKARNFIEGTSTIVIQDGKIQEENLSKEKYTVDELMQLLRKKNAFQVADVEFAILEADGELNVLLKKEKQPLTPKDMQMDVAPEKVPQMVILEGEVVDSALAAGGHTRAWLEVELEKLNVALDNVYIGQVDSYGTLTVDIYDDKINVPTANPRKKLLMSLKKCQADMESYALETDLKDVKEMYKKNAEILERVIKKSEHLLANE
ncbi:DUF421 domain-containing protein [Lederbergia lenta]|uniref:Membrane protein n=1 Tax=Lederbergia lenta TaxID=1467 RepID=A0A2X4WCZ1_LEDLE|nr:DUF421 domain-containing protein [Lederbergia lenta]MEC2324789.1 DUF421 domain-containing protein [Lederbergia lenta]SQI57748.1 membrane protein [Lederbergia lenta]